MKYARALRASATYRLGETGRLENPHHLVVDVDRARQRIRSASRSIASVRKPALAEEIRRDRTDRPHPTIATSWSVSAPLMCDSRRH